MFQRSTSSESPDRTVHSDFSGSSTYINLQMPLDHQCYQMSLDRNVMEGTSSPASKGAVQPLSHEYIQLHLGRILTVQQNTVENVAHVMIPSVLGHLMGHKPW